MILYGKIYAYGSTKSCVKAVMYICLISLENKTIVSVKCVKKTDKYLSDFQKRILFPNDKKHEMKYKKLPDHWSVTSRLCQNITKTKL